MEIRKPNNSVLVAAICVVYVLVRLWDLTASCLWFDEIFSIHAAEHSWSSLFWFVAQDLIHPPLFYLLLKIWVSIGGESLFWLRLFPVFFSVLALIPFLMVCKELKLRFQATVVALIFFAANGALIKYAQEVRMYSVLLLMSLLSYWLFTRFFIKGKSFAALVLVNILLVYTHYFGWLVVGSEIVAIVMFQRIKIRQTLLMFAITFACFVPWLLAVIQASNTGADVKQNIGWMARPGIPSIFEFAFDVVEPFYFQQSSAEPSQLLYIALPMLLLIAAAKIIYLLRSNGEKDRTTFYLLAIFSGVPIAIALIASWLLPVSIWGSRHLIIVFAPMMILSVIFITEIKWRIVRIGFISAAFLLIVVGFAVRLRAEQPAYIWCAWGKLADEWITEPHLSSEPKTLYVFEELVAYHFWFEVRNLRNYQVKIVKGVEGINEDIAYFLPRGFNDVEKMDVSELTADEFWIAFRDSRREIQEPGLSFLTRQKPPLSTLGALGYAPENVQKLEIGNQVAYLVLMRKEVNSR